MAERLTINPLIGPEGYQVPESYFNPRYRSIGGTPQADIAGSAEEAGIDPVLLGNVVGTESEYRNLLANRAGARGVGQFIPETGRQFGVNNLMDPQQSVYGAGRALDSYMDRYGSPDEALMAYNRGQGATDRYLQGQNIRGNLYDPQADPTGELNAGNFSRLPNQTQNYVWNNLRGTDQFGARGMLPYLDSTNDLSGAVGGAIPGQDWQGDLGDFDMTGQTPGGLYSPRGTDMRLGRFSDAEARGTAPNWTLPGQGGVLNMGDEPDQGASSLGNIARGMPDQQLAPGPRTDLEFYPYTQIGPHNAPDATGTPWTSPTDNQRFAGAFDLRGMPFEDRWGGLSPPFEDRWRGEDAFRPMEMTPGQRQNPDVWPQTPSGPPEDYRGLPTPYTLRFAGNSNLASDADPWGQGPPPDQGEAYRPGLEQRTSFERAGGVAGLGRNVGNWLYDTSADVAGQVAGGMGDLADVMGGLPPSLAWGGAGIGETPNEAVRGRFPQGDETFTTGFPRGRFDAATPGWAPQDNTPQAPQGGDNFILDAPSPDAHPISGRFDFLNGGAGPSGGLGFQPRGVPTGFDPGQLGTEDPGNGQPWPGSSFDERFPFNGPSFNDRLGGLNPPSGGMRDFADFRPGGQFPSMPQPGLDPVQSPPDTSMGGWRPGGDFPASGFPRGGMADFRDFTPGGGFTDDFGGRFPGGNNAPTNTFDARFPFQTDGPSTSGGGFSGLSRLGFPGGFQDTSPDYSFDAAGASGNFGGFTDRFANAGGGGSYVSRFPATFNPESATGGGFGYTSPNLRENATFDPAAYERGGFGYQSPTMRTPAGNGGGDRDNSDFWNRVNNQSPEQMAARQEANTQQNAPIFGGGGYIPISVPTYSNPNPSPGWTPSYAPGPSGLSGGSGGFIDYSPSANFGTGIGGSSLGFFTPTPWSTALQNPAPNWSLSGGGF